LIELTDSAAVKVKQLIEAEGDSSLALRVAVRPGGCSGFSYEMFFDTDVATDDLAAEYSGVRVVSDPSSAQLLSGATLDYKDGLTDAGFAINNPNASRTCGCGQSFS
jgi:iron-sulfur cluster assembly protein/iron-sulfur cluster insertion protein